MLCKVCVHGCVMKVMVDKSPISDMFDESESWKAPSDDSDSKETFETVFCSNERITGPNRRVQLDVEVVECQGFHCE